MNEGVAILLGRLTTAGGRSFLDRRGIDDAWCQASLARWMCHRECLGVYKSSTLTSSEADGSGLRRVLGRAFRRATRFHSVGGRTTLPV